MLEIISMRRTERCLIMKCGREERRAKKGKKKVTETHLMLVHE